MFIYIVVFTIDIFTTKLWFDNIRWDQDDLKDFS